MYPDFGQAVRESRDMKALNTILMLLICLVVAGLSGLRLVQRSRGHFTGYGPTADLPESWRRWIFGEKSPRPRPR